jgi:hypothetical protein
LAEEESLLPDGIEAVRGKGETYTQSAAEIAPSFEARGRRLTSIISIKRQIERELEVAMIERDRLGGTSSFERGWHGRSERSKRHDRGEEGDGKDGRQHVDDFERGEFEAADTKRKKGKTRQQGEEWLKV